MRLRELSERTTPVYVCANALPHDQVPLDVAIRLACEAGADGFELRRELLPSELTPAAIQRLHEALSALHAPPVYSVPQAVFLHGRLEREPVTRALTVARAFGCHLVKFAPGETLRPDDDAFDALCALLSAAEERAPGLLVSLENDQTPVSADLEAWVRLFERVRTQGRALGMTFDLGNWTCLHLDAAQVAQTLGRFVVYVHVKAVRREAHLCDSEPIQQSATPHPALAHLPQHAPRAVEFPVAADGYDALCEKLHTYIKRQLGCAPRRGAELGRAEERMALCVGRTQIIRFHARNGPNRPARERQT